MKLFTGPAGDCIATKGQGPAASFSHLRSIGLNAQEIEFVQQVFLNPRQAEAAGAAARENGVRLSIHAPYFINLCSDDKSKLAASKKRIADSLDRAEAMAAEGPVVVHPGFFMKRSKAECLDAVVSACVELADSHPKAVLGLETTGKHSAFGSLDEILETCRLVRKKNCVPVVDFAHVYARNMGNIDFSSVLDALLKDNHKTVSCHFSGINYSSKGELNHLPISANQPAYAQLAKALKDRQARFDSVTLVCESPLLEQDALEMRAILDGVGLTL